MHQKNVINSFFQNGKYKKSAVKLDALFVMILKAHYFAAFNSW